MTVIWIDVTDFLEYAANNHRASGIQRMCFEIWNALQQGHGAAGRIRFVTQRPAQPNLSTLPWETLRAIYEDLASHQEPPQAAAPVVQRQPAAGLGLRRAVAGRVPPRLRTAIAMFRRHLLATIRSFGQVVVESARLLHAPEAVPRRRRAIPAGEDITALARPGDVLLVLGSPWAHLGFGARVARLQREHGMRFAILVHDMIPLSRPEWFDPIHTGRFRRWHDEVLPLCDHIFANSRSTAADIRRYGAQSGLAVPAAISVLPVGTSFTAFGPADLAAPSADLPQPGSYVLFVSTIEVRKNHLLLLRVWRHLLETMPAEELPQLVFAGRVGWLVEDLMRQLANCDYLSGRIRIIAGPSDTDLAALYRGCLFTLYPSLYEGWGLPVSESLAMGKPCLVARNSSLTDAGGALARYFDAQSTTDAAAAIRAVLDDRPGLAAWTAQVQTAFQQVSWNTTAHDVMEALT